MASVARRHSNGRVGTANSDGGRSPRKAKQKATRRTSNSEEKPKEDKTEKLKAMFRQFDSDGNGTISRRELEVVLMRLGKFDGRTISRIMDEVDANDDGAIQFEEFIDWVQGGTSSAAPDVTDRGAMSFDFESMVRPLFQVWDRDASGMISHSEFRECLSTLNGALEAATMKRMTDHKGNATGNVSTLVAGAEDRIWKAANSDSDEGITLSEFACWMQHAVENSGLEKEHMVELTERLSLLLENVFAISSVEKRHKSSSSDNAGTKKSVDTISSGLLERVGECGMELFDKGVKEFKRAKSLEGFHPVEAEPWRNLPSAQSRSSLIRRHMQDSLPTKDVVKLDVSIKMCVPAGTLDRLRLLSMVVRTIIYKTRQGMVPPGEPIHEQWFYANDGDGWISFGKDGTEFFSTVKALPNEMRLYAALRATADEEQHIWWSSILSDLAEAVDQGLITVEDQVAYNEAIEEHVMIAIAKQDKNDKTTDLAEKLDLAKRDTQSFLEHVPFRVGMVMAQLTSMGIFPPQPLWAEEPCIPGV